MKFLTDFLPIVLFFIAYQLYDIYVATAVAIVSSLFQVAYLRLAGKKVEKMHLITLGLLLLFGGLTLLLRDPMFIKWKPTVVNWLFGIVFLGSQTILPCENRISSSYFNTLCYNESLFLRTINKLLILEKMI